MTDEIVQEFIVESHENLDQVDRDLIALEKTPGDQDILARVFRAVHTIKGTCGFLGFGKLESVAHVGENLLSKLRTGELQMTTDIASALLRLVDAIREILKAIEASGAEGEVEYDELKRRLAQLTEAGEILAQTEPPAQEVTLPAPTDQQPESGSESDVPRLGEILVEQGKVPEETVQDALCDQALGDQRPIGEILIDSKGAKTGDVLDAMASQQEAHAVALTEGNIRVDVGLLDKLMTLVGELVLARNQVLQFSQGQDDSGFLSTSQRLNIITTELQEGLMKTRMQPIRNVWNKFPRLVRDVEISVGKQVKMDMEGQSTELDKTIIEAIKDPLTHLVRNAIDHGIETPEVRLAKGKQARGRLLLRAFHEGGQVNIEIIDDGAGIDAEKVKRKAIERGLIAQDVAMRMSEREAFKLIFLPGLSTAPKVTNISGRGVGMDVVRTNIERIGGIVDIHSKINEGTTIRIKIPLTLAIIPALICSCGGDRFAIPQVNLLELVRLEGEMARQGIEHIHNAPVYRLRGRLLPLVYLNRQLQLSSDNARDDVVNIVVLRADDRQFGLVVDRIQDTEEIVVKPLSKQLKGISVFAGTTIMGDGKVALILDVPGIAQQSGVVSETRDRSLSDGGDDADGAGSGNLTTVLLCRVGDRQRLAIPLDTVDRLEEFSHDAIEMAQGNEVIQYRGRIMPLRRLSDSLGVPRSFQAEEPSTHRVVVVRDRADRPFGLIVDQIDDIVEVPLAMGDRKDSGETLIGSAIIQGVVTDLVNVRSLLGSGIITSDQLMSA